MPTSHLRRAASAAAVTAAGALAFAGAAGAQTTTTQSCYPPRPDCVTTTSAPPTQGVTLTLSVTVAVRGQTITASTSGFKPGTSGILTIASVEQQIGTFTSSAAATSSTPVTIPTNIELGPHTAFAHGTGMNGAPATASAGITIVAAGTTTTNNGTTSGSNGSSLARTGAVVIPTALVGLALVGGGVVLKRSGRRRGKTSSAA